MGCFQSKIRKKSLGHEDPQILASQTAFSVSEVEALFELYKSISSSVIDDGLIDKEELQLALFKNKKKENLFANRIFELFDVKQKGVIDFGDFVRSLNVFHPNASLEDKINFSFTLYDMDSTGFIERQEVKQMTFLEVDVNQDGKIDRTEWLNFVTKNPSLLKIMTLSYLTSVFSFIVHYCYCAIGNSPPVILILPMLRSHLPAELLFPQVSSITELLDEKIVNPAVDVLGFVQR